MFVGVCRLTLMVPESHSLKEKRMVLRRIKDRVRLKFNAAIAEVNSQDAWQQAVLACCVVANERPFVDEMLSRIVNFVEALAIAKIVDDEKDVVCYGDDGELDSNGYKHWEPEEESPRARGNVRERKIRP